MKDTRSERASTRSSANCSSSARTVRRWHREALLLDDDVACGRSRDSRGVTARCAVRRIDSDAEGIVCPTSAAVARSRTLSSRRSLEFVRCSFDRSAEAYVVWDVTWSTASRLARFPASVGGFLCASLHKMAS